MKSAQRASFRWHCGFLAMVAGTLMSCAEDEADSPDGIADPVVLEQDLKSSPLQQDDGMNGNETIQQPFYCGDGYCRYPETYQNCFPDCGSEW